VAQLSVPERQDLVVVGGGILGLAVARELLIRRPGASLTLLEREPRLAAHQTSHSSGVIHAGIYYRPGSLKARLCVEGAGLLYGYCEQRGIEARRDGKLIVAASGDELPRLDELERRGRANGVADLRRLGAREIAAVEPHAAGVAALHSPNTGVVDFARVSEELAADVRRAGGRIVTAVGVRRLRGEDGSVRVEHDRGETVAGLAVACAGAWSDRLAVASGAPPEPRIVPFRGGYLRLRAQRTELVRGSIYPVPDPELPFLGAHASRTIDGRVLIGPSALLVAARDAYRPWRLRPSDLAATISWPGSWRLAWRFRRTAIGELARAASPAAFVRDLRRLLPELEPGDVEAGPAGIRAQALARDGSLIDDFVLHRTEGAVHVRNAPSPAATSCLALAHLIADRAGVGSGSR
jgi:L-2-hydroxyglutarate oxidase